MNLRVLPIVEGHGEDQAIRILLQRIGTELLDGKYIEVVKAIRQPRAKLGSPDGLRKAVQLAASKLRMLPDPDVPGMVLVLIDRDPDIEPPCVLGPKLLEQAQFAQPDIDICCVVANWEYETWFVAAAESLRKYLDIADSDVIPDDPEAGRCKKAWILNRRRNYSPTVDQPAMTAKMDLSLVRKRSLSFDKLCREIEKRLG